VGFRLNQLLKREYYLELNGERRSFKFEPTPSGQAFEHGFRQVDEAGVQFLEIEGHEFRISWPRSLGSAHGPASSGTILSPMPGRIIAVEVTQGQTVTKGQKLLTLEAMKMEHSLTAPFDGVVTELTAETGAQVQVDIVLVKIEAA
jgi:3-methylcrotonyl-CoA carboxylase alpha subunit